MLLDNSELINYSHSQTNTRQPFPVPFVPIPFGPIFVPPVFGFPPIGGYPPPPPPPPRPNYRNTFNNTASDFNLSDYTIYYVPILFKNNSQ